jgi:hypothetical protein
VPEGEAANPEALSVSASFKLTVANPAPVLEADSGRTAEDTPLAVTVAEGLLFNDKDGAPDSDPLTVTQFTFAVAAEEGDAAGDDGDNDGGTAGDDGDAGGDAGDGVAAPTIYKAGEKAEIEGVGSLTIHANGSYTFVPADDYDGDVPVATYWVSDREGGVVEATLALAITPVNDAPVVKPLDDRTAKDGEIVSYALADRFSDIEKDTLRYVATGLPKGLSIDAATGTISGTIDRSASQVDGGSYTVTVTAHDRAAVPDGEPANPEALSVSASFTLTVANPAPVLAADSGRTAEDTPLAVTVAEGLLFNDKDGAPDSDPLTVTQFTFAVAQDAGDTAGDDGDGGDNDGNVNGNVGHDGDTDDDAGDAAAAPTLYKAGQKAEIAGVGSLTIHANGSYTFVPADDYDGEVPLATYWVSDREGGVAEATLALAITPVNDAPVAKPLDDRAAKDGETVSYALADRFSDIEKDTLRYVATGLPKGLSIDAATGTISGTIDRSASQVDGGTYTVTVTAHDRAAVPEGEPANPEALSVSASFTLTVSNPAPVLEADSGRTAEDTTLAVTAAEGLLFNDKDGAPDRDPLTVTQFTFAAAKDAGDTAGGGGDNDGDDDGANDGDARGDAGGDTAGAADAGAAALTLYKAGETAEIMGVGSLTIHANGSYTFVPADDYDGEVPLATYWVSDGEGGVVEATLALAITPVNDAPVARPLDDRTAKDGEVVSYALADRFSDIEKDRLRYVATGLPKGLSIDAATGTISGTIDRSASRVDGGTYTVTVTAYDRAEGYGEGDAQSVSASFTLDVRNIEVEGVSRPEPRVIHDAPSFGRIEAAGLVLDTVDGYANADADSGIVYLAASERGDVKGTTLPEEGVVGAAVHQSNARIEHDEHSLGASSFSLPAEDAGPGEVATAEPVGFASDGLRASWFIRDRRVYITLAEDAPAPRMHIVLPDGRPLPDWLTRVDANIVTGTLPDGILHIDLLIRREQDGTIHSQLVRFDLVSGTITSLDGAQDADANAITGTRLTDQLIREAPFRR